MSSKHQIPKKLEEDLNNVKYYKPSSGSEKAKSVAAVLDDSVERAMYDEILGPMMNRKSSIPSTRLDNAKQLANSTTGPTDFNTSILTRLQTVEADNKNLRRQLAEQLSYNEKLEKDVVDLKSLVNDPEELKEELEYFRNKNRELQTKIKEMEAFLADYGLEWVGGEGGPAADVAGEDSPGDGVAFSDFLRCIQELNAVVYSDPAQVVTDGNNSRKARLVQASELVENIKITFYKNGLMIRRGPFRESGSESYCTFMNDILDGYFPSEFKKEFPDGVTFDVTDKHSVVYVEGQDSDSRMSAAQLLNRLPKTIIKNGELIAVRGDIESRLGVGKEETKGTTPSSEAAGGKMGGMVVLATAAYRANNTGSSPLGMDVGTTVVQIQVKWTGKGVSQALLAHMFESDTIENLRSEIKQHFVSKSEAKSGSAGGEALNIELRSAYPPRILSDSMTLKEAGLLPNGTVHARGM